MISLLITKYTTTIERLFIRNNMENIGLLLIFWYGILHAFGADHLTAIAECSGCAIDSSIDHPLTSL